jgi:16S rRNA (uracil1498-N3)-methyltransferase
VPRFFADIQEQGEAVITGKDVHHILGPLRRKIGDELPIRDNERGYRARITGFSPGRITLEVLSSQELSERCSCRVHLGMSLIDLKDMDDLMRCVTELGVSEIHPLVSGRSNVREIGEKRLQRWRQIIMEAVKQCERRSIPVLHEPMMLQEFLKRVSPAWPCRLVASLSSDAGLQDYRHQEAGILIGPEGGFPDQEMENILSSGFVPVHMGKTILRSYTAAVTAVGALAM